jgi:hypothetical protein
MPAAKTKTAAKKAAKKKAATRRAAEKKLAAPAKAPTRASTKKAANKKVVATKVPKKKAAKKSAAKPKPGLTRTVNMGPERGDNSWPPSAKKMRNVSDRAPGTEIKGSPAKDSTSGPGGKATEGGTKGENGGGTGNPA